MVLAMKASVFAALLGTTYGHMKMKTPAPYGAASLNNSPLDPSGSDFPCKQRQGVYVKSSANTVMAIGEQQTLSFTGSAVHGGGSCQIALSKDTEPTKGSQWMVIKSIIGGCPANVPGNLPEDANGSGASTFQYTIPAGIEPGDYALSWTWFNKVGNREMYQNCAPITVTGAKKRRWAPTPKQSRRDTSSFPNIFVANIGNGVSTPENADIIFPNPGADVQTAGIGPFSQMPGGNGGAGSPPQQTQTQAAATATTEATTATTAYGGGAQQSGYGGNNGGNGGNNGGNGGNGGGATVSPAGFAEGASSASSGAVTPVNSDGTPLATSAPVAPAAPAATAAPDTGKSSNGTGTSSSGACTEGNWNCLDGSSFQRCASGSWSSTMQLAAGMKCEIGESANIAMSKVTKRSHSHGHGHVHVLT